MGIFRMGYKGTGHPGTIPILILTIYKPGFGGGTGSENNTVRGKDAVTVTAGGIESCVNGYYTMEELADA